MSNRSGRSLLTNKLKYKMKTLQKFVIFIILVIIILIIFASISLSKYLGNVEPAGIEEDKQIMVLIERHNMLSKWDATEQYRITPKLLRATSSFAGPDVTLVTQCSTQHLHFLVNLAQVWQGPISVAVFSKATDSLLTITRLYRLTRCYEAIERFVTFHMVTFEGNGNLRFRKVGPPDCASLHGFIEERKNYDMSIPYPVNVMRNLARTGVGTDFMLLIDVDMLPSPDLRANWHNMDKSSVEKQAVYVIPAFELEPKVPPPPTKADVTKLVKNGFMRPFYADLCAKCHSCVDYTSWYKLPSSQGLSVGYKATWTDACEPFYISRRDIPAYDESFKQYGFNRISQVCELYVAGFKFQVLDSAFLVHIGMKTKENFHTSKDVEQESNRKLFREFKQRLKYLYPDSPRNC